MSARTKITSKLQEAWSRTKSGWQGPHAEAYHSEFVVRITEAAEAFEGDCDKLSELASAFSAEMAALETSV